MIGEAWAFPSLPLIDHGDDDISLFQSFFDVTMGIGCPFQWKTFIDHDLDLSRRYDVPKIFEIVFCPGFQIGNDALLAREPLPLDRITSK